MFPFLKDMYLQHRNARHETMRLQNMCRRYVIVVGRCRLIPA